ncbi:MAG: formylglycine-generating enzyme family protein [Verrucomicrobia bacterium]|nr:formylglycine-generating enzyme family protein [Verrucomicrobiota bacterium]
MTLLVLIGSEVNLADAQSIRQQNPAKELLMDLGGGVKMGRLWIPAGSFKRGDAKGPGYEQSVHQVNITKPFYLGKYEVTQEQWQAVMGNNPSYFKNPTNPVESVSWIDCQRFARRMNEKFAIPGEKYALPTEAQWEYACRAARGTRYFFGDDEKALGDYAWYDDNSGNKTHPVGRKLPNAWGLYDMLGNAWEWCQDWHAADYYAKSPPDDPTGPVAGTCRSIGHVARGGSWDYPAGQDRTLLRDYDAPEYKLDDLTGC